MSTRQKILILLLCLGALSGCSTYSTLTSLKDAGRDTETVRIIGTIDNAKEIVRKVARRWDIIERKEAEKDNYMTYSSNFGKTITQAFFSPVLAQTRRLGFFFEYDKERNTTTVFIAETAQGALVESIRGHFAEEIKLIQMEKTVDRLDKK